MGTITDRHESQAEYITLTDNYCKREQMRKNAKLCFWDGDAKPRPIVLLRWFQSTMLGGGIHSMLCIGFGCGEMLPNAI